MELKIFLKEAIPDSWLVRGFLLFQSLLVAVLYAWGQALQPRILNEIDSLLLLKTSAVCLAIVCWLVTYIGCLLYKLKKKNDELNDEDRHIKKLTTETINVLKTISDAEEWLEQRNFESIEQIPKSDLLNINYFSNKLKMSTQSTKHHFDQLNNAKLIHIFPDGELCGTTAKGRDVLHKKELLT